MKDTIINIQEPVSRMIKKFRESKIALSVAEGKLYDETTSFNEQNINEYLAEVEEYIKCLLTVMANQFGIKCPILMSLGLDELPRKIEPAVFPKDNAINTEDDKEPDEETLNNMLDRSKFNSMMMEIMEKHRETSKALEDESKAQEDENQEQEDQYQEDKKDENAEEVTKDAQAEGTGDDQQVEGKDDQEKPPEDSKVEGATPEKNEEVQKNEQ